MCPQVDRPTGIGSKRLCRGGETLAGLATESTRRSDPSEDHATGVKTKNNRFQPDPARSDSPEEVSYGQTHVLLHGDGPPCPRFAGHGGGGINSIVAGRAASLLMLAYFPVILFSTSGRELDQ